jgi:hypothetical protein
VTGALALPLMVNAGGLLVIILIVVLVLVVLRVLL